jgi:hypothetical protein
MCLMASICAKPSATGSAELPRLEIFGNTQGAVLASRSRVSKCHDFLCSDMTTSGYRLSHVGMYCTDAPLPA